MSRLDACNFSWEATMLSNDVMRVVVTQKATGRKWEREATEFTWPSVRDELLKAIEKDLSTPFDAVPVQ